MSSLTRSSWPRRFAAVLVAVLGLGAMTTLSAKPADARVFVSFGVGGPGWGIYHPGYWYRPYYRPYYPAYYRNWQWRRWCSWHPYRCTR